MRLVEADERAGECGEGVVDVASALVASDEPAVAVDPGEGALDDPAMSAQLLAGLDAASGDAGRDPAAAAGLAAPPMVVCLVGVQLVRPAPCPAGLAADRRDAVQQLLERLAVVGVSTGQHEGEWDAVPVGNQVALGAEPASIGRVRACLVTPLFGRQRGAVDAGPAPVDPVGRPQPAEHHAGQAVPPAPPPPLPPAGLAAGVTARGAGGPRRPPPASPAGGAST